MGEFGFMRFKPGRRSFLLGTASIVAVDYVLLVSGFLSSKSASAAFSRTSGEPITADSTLITVDSTLINICQDTAVQPPPVGQALVAGTTFNSSGIPEEAVRVRALDPDTRDEFARVFSDTNGLYSLDLDPGTYDIRANKPGWGAISRTATAKAGEVQIVDFGSGTPPPGDLATVTGTTYNSSGLPEEGVRVRALDPDTRTEFARVFSDTNGLYSLDLDAGTYEMRANKSGWGATSETVTVGAGETRTVDISQ